MEGDEDKGLEGEKNGEENDGKRKKISEKCEEEKPPEVPPLNQGRTTQQN